MSMKQKMLPIVASAFSYCGLNKMLITRYGGRGVILMMHAIHKDDQAPINKAGTISQSYFELVLKAVSQSDFEPIRLQDIPERLKSNKKRRFISLTFDDGYKNNLELAVPLLEKYNIPATMFITSNGMIGNLDYEWGALEYYLSVSDSITIDMLNLKTKSLLQKRQAYQKIAQACLADYQVWKPKLLNFFKKESMNLNDLSQNAFLDRDGVKQLARSPMVDIGGHTVSHPMLSKLSESEALHEMQKNKTDLEKLLDREIFSFAYPYGGTPACAEREFKFASQIGYKVAVTTRAGAIFNDHKDYVHALPRFGISGLYETKPMLDMVFSGSMRALRSRFGVPFVV